MKTQTANIQILSASAAKFQVENKLENKRLKLKESVLNNRLFNALVINWTLELQTQIKLAIKEERRSFNWFVQDKITGLTNEQIGYEVLATATPTEEDIYVLAYLTMLDAMRSLGYKVVDSDYYTNTKTIKTKYGFTHKEETLELFVTFSF
jgi:hypothetical protein